MSELNTTNAVSAYLGDKKEQTVNATKSSMYLSVDTNPDYEAELRKVSAKTGIPVDSAAAFPEEAKRAARMADINFNDMASRFPSTTKFLSDVGNAKVSHDDVENLSGIEKGLDYLKKGGSAFASSLPQANAGLWGVAQSGADLLSDFVGKPLAGTLLPEDPFARLSSGIADLRKMQQGLADRMMPAGAGPIESGVYSGLQSTGQTLLTIPAAILTGKPDLTLAAMAATTGGQSYAKAKDAGKNTTESLLYGTSDAVVEAGTEGFSLGPLLSGLKAGAPFLKVMLGNQLREQFGEQSATLLQDLNEWAVMNPEKSFGDYLKARPDAAIQTAVATVVGSGTQVTILKAAQVAATKAGLMQTQVQQADATAAQLTDLNHMAETSKLRPRDPEAFKAFINQAMEDGPVNDLYLSAESLSQSGVNIEELAKLSPSFAEQVNLAAEIGGDIRIPIDEFMTTIGGTELAQSLIPHLRTDPNALSQAQAQEQMKSAGESMQKEVERVLSEHADDNTFNASRDAVAANFQQQFDTAARFTPDVNKAYAGMAASFYSVAAAKVGVTPEQLAAQYPLRVQAESLVGDQTLSQVSGDVSEVAKKWQESGIKAGIYEGQDGITLSKIIVPTEARGVGAGSKAMQQLIEYADSVGKRVMLSPSADFGGNKNRLVNFYKKFGFVENKGKNKDYSTTESMYRDPVGNGQQDNAKLNQTKRGSITLSGDMRNQPTVITLLENADLSTALHEFGHFFLEVYNDLATQENAPAEIKNDLNAVFKWFGKDMDSAKWNAMNLEEKRDYHEQFARGFESYLFEGKSPNIEMRGVFSRFRSWLMNIYRSASNLNVQLSDEVRGVFDRMLASTETIKEAEAIGNLMPAFATAEEAGMTTEQFKAYHDLGMQATQDAISTLETRSLRDLQWLDNAKSKALKKLQRDAADKRKAVRAEVESEVMAEPVNQVRNYLKRGEVDGVKVEAPSRLSLPRMKEMYVDALNWRSLGRGKDGMLEDKGSSPDSVAKMFGYSNGKELVNDLIAADKLKDQIKAAAEEATKEVSLRQVNRVREWLQKGEMTSDSGEVIKVEKGFKLNTEALKSMFPPEELGATDLSALRGMKEENGLHPDLVAEMFGYSNGFALIHDLITADKLKDQIKNAVEEATKEVNAKPVNKAREWLQKGEITNEMGGVIKAKKGYKLDIEEIKAMFPLNGLGVSDFSFLKGMTAEEGVHPDLVAESFGYSSGDQMVQDLLSQPKPREKIEVVTDQRMLEKYGDINSPESLAVAVDQSVYNDARTKFINTEANAFSKAVGAPSLIASAAKQFAADLISRVRIRDLKPSQYSNAEARAAKESANARKKGDIAEAARQKRNQSIQNYATRAAISAREEIDKTLRYLKKFSKESIRSNLPADYVNQIDMLLDKYDLRDQSLKQVDRTKALRSWVLGRISLGESPAISEALLSAPERAAFDAEVQSRNDEGDLIYADDDSRLVLLADAIERSAKRSYKEMTVEEFSGLRDTIQQIEHLGRLKDKLMTAREGQTYAETRDLLVNTIVENAKSSGKNVRTDNTWIGSKLQGLKQFGISHIKPAIQMQVFDGGKDNGPWWSTIVRPANERASFESTKRAIATNELMRILGPVLKNVSAMDKIGKGRFFPEIGTSLNWEERFTIACQYGNEGNLQRLMGGGIGGVSLALDINQVHAVLRTLSEQEWLAVQGVWDHFESYRPEIAAKELRVSGVEPDWVTPRQFSVKTSDGKTITLKGGYYPVVYDSRTNLKAQQHNDAQAAKDAMKASYSAATTQRSFTKSREEEVKGRPLLLNLSGLYSGVNDVIHDLAWHEWVIDANRLLRSKSIDEAIREHYGPEVKKELTKWRDDIVAGTKRLDHGIENAVGWARKFVSSSALTYNVISALLQPIGIGQSFARVGVAWVGRGIGQYISNPVAATVMVKEKSEFMNNRTRTMFRDLNELRNRVAGQTTARELMGRYGYFMTMHCQMMVDVPTWIGAYEKAISEGRDDGTAIAIADQSVKDSQGGGEEVDQAGITRGGPMVKLFTAFYDFMNTQANVLYLKGATSSSKADAFMHFAMIGVAIPFLTAALKDAIVPGDSGDWDDWESILKKLLSESLSNLVGMVAFGREFTQVTKALYGDDKGMGYSGPTGLRVIPDTYKLAKQINQGEMDDAFRKSFISALGDVSGIPSVQINRGINGAQALQEGKTDNPAALLFGYQTPHK